MLVMVLIRSVRSPSVSNQPGSADSYNSSDQGEGQEVTVDSSSVNIAHCSNTIFS